MIIFILQLVLGSKQPPIKSVLGCVCGADYQPPHLVPSYEKCGAMPPFIHVYTVKTM